MPFLVFDEIEKETVTPKYSTAYGELVTGEYIEVGSVGGNVERINTRSLSLRTPEGAVHTVPFGSLNAVANYSRDWAIVKMEFKVTYDTDLAKVKKIFRGIGDELSKDAELAPGFIQPFKFQGVKAMDETGIIVRGKFMAVPGTQYVCSYT